MFSGFENFIFVSLVSKQLQICKTIPLQSVSIKCANILISVKVGKINNSVSTLGCTQWCYMTQTVNLVGADLSVQINRYSLLHVPLRSYTIDNNQLSKSHLKKQGQKAIGTKKA